MNFGNKILKYQDDMIKDLARLVAIPSVVSDEEPGRPFGKESAAALSVILQMAHEMGLATKNVGNYAGHAELGAGDEVAASVTHVDVVPAGEGWETDPFTLTKKGDLYFGRGTADDKGASIAALYCLKALKDEKVIGKRRIRAIFGAGEETGSNDLEMYFKSERMPVMAFTPDSEYGICNREKGLLRMSFTTDRAGTKVVKSFAAGTVMNAVPAKAEARLACTEKQCDDLREAAKTAEGKFELEKTADGVKIRSEGKASHAMQPQEGFNAASYLVKLLASVFSEDELGPFLTFLSQRIGTETDGEKLGVKQQDAESGPLTLNLGLVRMDGEKASCGIDIRYPVTSRGNEISALIQKCAAESGLEPRVLSDVAPLYLPGDTKLVTLLQGAYESVMGEPCGLYATGGGTYARAFHGNAVAFGLLFPDEPDRRLHNTNEHIDIRRFLQHAQICLEAMYRMFTA